VKKLLLPLLQFAFLFFACISFATAQSLEMFSNFHDSTANIPGSALINGAILKAADPKEMLDITKLPAKFRSNYYPSTLVSEEVSEDIIDMLKANDTRMTIQINSRFLKSDIEGHFEQVYGPIGLKRNDLADAAAAYWITMWMIVNKNGYPSSTQVQKIRQQIFKQLVKNGALNQIDSAKQRVAQFYMWKSVLALIALEDPRIDRRLLAQIAEQKTRALGFNLAQTQLTKEGFLLPSKK
jgi:hypothetical protein